MGLDASVMCGCYRDGLTSEPPVPRDWLEIDSDGYLNLKAGRDSTNLNVHGWMEKCCPHPDMRAAWEAIANWYGYRLFQQALEKLHFLEFDV